jgi:hypothetical protein
MPSDRNSETAECLPPNRFERGRHWLIRASERQDMVWHPGLQMWNHVHSPATAYAIGWRYERASDP